MILTKLILAYRDVKHFTEADMACNNKVSKTLQLTIEDYTIQETEHLIHSPN